MPRDLGKGKKAHKRQRTFQSGKQELVEKGEGQEYAQVLRMQGNSHLEASCFDGVIRLCRIRGRMRNTSWANRVSKSDIILVALRNYQDNKADVILKYTSVEARELKRRNALPTHVQIGDGPESDEGAGFEFADGVADDTSDTESILPQPIHIGMLPPSCDNDDGDFDIDDL